MYCYPSPYIKVYSYGKKLSGKRFLYIFISLISVFLTFFDQAQAQWTSATVLNTAINLASLDQDYHTMIRDDLGGAIIAWRDGRNGSTNYDIYAQRIDGDGNLLWNSNGVAICTATGNQLAVSIVSDGSNGAIITWSDNRNANWDIYAQRINSSGVAQWTSNGIAICTEASGQYDPIIITDMLGGAIISWDDARGNGNVYAQRVNSSGVVQWTANGVGICTPTSNQAFENIVSDNQNGAVIAWRDYRNGTWDIYVQRINSAGTVQWTADGIPVCIAANTQEQVAMTMNYTGVILAWRDGRNGTSNHDIYAQRIDLINPGGVMQWTTNGAAVCTATNDQYNPSITTPFLGAALIAWHDARNGTSNTDIYAQFMNAGTPSWQENGIAICSAPGNQYKPTLTMNGISYESIITWYDNRSWNLDIYAQSINHFGTLRWTTDGVLISDASGIQRDPLIVRDGVNGGIITWIDERSGTTTEDIYAMRIDRSGILYDTGNPAQPTGLTATASPSVDKRITLNWAASPSGDVVKYAIYRHTSTFTDTVNRRIATLGIITSYNDQTPSYGTFYYRVYAIDGAGHVSSSSNIINENSPDHLNPNPPASLSATASQSIERRINLSWTASSSGDVTAYILYRHTGTLSDTTNHFIANTGVVTNFADTPPSFGTYYYKVFARDGSGNVSTASNEVNETTLYAEPTSHPANFIFSGRSTSGLSISFDAAPGPPSGYLAIRRAGAAPSGLPADRTNYSPGNTIGDGVVAYVGNITGFNDAGLVAATRYYYNIFSYNGESQFINYLTTVAPLSGNAFTFAIQPTNQATNLIFSNITSSSFTITFTAAVGPPNGYLVLRRFGAAPTSVPQDGIVYNMAQNVGDAYVSYVGSNTTFNESGLSQGTYYFSIYAYNGSGEAINYLTINPLENNQSTLVSEPAYQPSNAVFSIITSSSFILSFTPASDNPSGYLVLRRAGQSPSSIPQDGIAYTVGQNLNGDMVAYVGSTVSINQQGLSPNTVYYYDIFSYNGTSATTNYLSSQTPLEASHTTLDLAPLSQPTNITFSNRTSSTYTVSYSPAIGTPAGYIALRRLSASPTSKPSGGTNYSQGQILGDALVAYIGAQNSFNESGLNASSEYYYDIFSFNGSGEAINYLGDDPLEGNETTLAVEPTAQATNLMFSNITDTSFTMEYSGALGNPEGYIVLMRLADYPDVPPQDGYTYNINDQIGSAKVVFLGSGTSINLQGLDVGNTYFFSIFSFNGSGHTTNYLSDFPLQGSKLVESDAQSPAISDVEVSPAVPIIGTNILINADVSDNNSLAGVSLFYKKLSSLVYLPQVIMNPVSGTQYQGIIPSSVVTFNGVDFKIVAIDNAGNDSTYYGSISVDIPADTISTGNIPGNPYQAGFPESQWRMISVPLILDNPEAGQVLQSFGTSGKYTWKLYDSEGNDVSASASFTPGKAFWLQQRLGEGAKEIRLGSGACASLNDGDIILLEGWNQIGNPFTFAIDWFLQTNGPDNLEIKGPIKWDGTKYVGIGQTMGVDTTLTELLPWEGYFIYNSSNTSQVLQINPNKPLLTLKPLIKIKREQTVDWKINLRAKIGEYEDIYNFIGTAADARTGDDHYDLPEMPVIGPHVSLYFLSDELYPATIDFRNTTSEGHTWDMEIVSNVTDKEAILKWTGEKVSENLQVKLFDISNNKIISSQNLSYSYSNRYAGHPVKFKIFVGTEEYVNRELTQTQNTLPDNFELRQNYPNPFNAQTTLEFRLRETTRLSISIYNILGQQVRNIISNGLFDTGEYRAVWDSKNDDGREVGSGIYFAFLKSDVFQSYIKMIIVR